MEEKYSTIIEAVKKHAEETPYKLAVGDKKNQATYSELWCMIRRGATYLKTQGVNKGDVIVIKGANKIQYIVSLLSAHLMGAAACPTEKAIKEDRVIEIMDFVDSKVYLSDKPVQNKKVKNISMKELFKVSRDDESPMDEFELPNPDDLSEILFTTGTTGKSKGIRVTFGCNIYIAENVIDSVAMGRDEVELITTPINHSLAIRRTYGALYNGSSVVYSEGFKFANSFYKLLDNYNITAITFVPAILEQVLADNKNKFAEYNKQLNYIQLGSAPLSEKNKEILIEMFPDVRLYNTYGATESGCTVILEFSKYNDKKKCIGRTTANTRILFVDDNRKEVKATPNNPGLLAFQGGMNMEGYHKEPEITKEVMDEKGIVYTNDLGYLGKDGLVYLLGRRGDVINMGGIKIAPTEIEEVAMGHYIVKDCACVPVEDNITGQAPKLYVSLNDGYDFDQVELTKYLLDKLESIKVPKIFEVIDEIPRTFNGKIIRKQLV